MPYDEGTAERVRGILSGRRGVIEKKLMGGLCFMVDGSMCCSVSAKGGLLVRIEPHERDHMLREPHVKPMEMRGRTMSGFVRIAPEGYRTAAALRTWIERGIKAGAARRPKRRPAGTAKRAARKRRTA